jgi:hypothetical protein
LDVLGGVNLYVPAGNGFLSRNRLLVEAGAPVYQYLNGPQLQTTWTLNASWQYSW